MNENSMARNSWLPVCENEPGIQWSGCNGVAGCYYFTRQAISQFTHGGVASTLMERQYKSPDDLIVEEKKMPSRKYIVRRLTPTECARLQGFPDWWTDGVEGSDSAKYKMWGNGIALPCAVDVIGRIANELRSGRK